MTMSDGALDLSISSQPSQRASRGDQGGSDSGRASTDSTSSDHHEDVIRAPRLLQHQQPPPLQLRDSPLGPHNHGSQVHSSGGGYSESVMPRSYSRSPPSGRERDPAEMVSPGHLYKPPAHLLPTFTSSAGGGGPPSPRSPPAPLPPQQSQVGSGPSLTGTPPPAAPLNVLEKFGDVKPPLHAALASDRISTSNSSATSPDARVAPIRPFKMYPVDPFNVYSPSLLPGGMGGAGGGGTLSPTPMGLQSLYESASPTSFPSFPLTHLTSHLLQRKRRAESRSDSNNSSSGASPAVSTSVAGNASSTQALITTSSSGAGDNVGSVTTSSPASPGKRSGENDSSAGSDGEKRMRGASPTSNDSSGAKKDDAYWDRRRKNNEAAKRSRDARRQKEEEIAMRAAFLEQENLKLRAQVAILKNETAKLHYMLYNRI